MTNWTKVIMDAGVGGAVGVADQFLQNQDEERGLAARALPVTDPGHIAADAKLPLLRQFGTYFNYGVPLATIVAVAMGWVRGDMETRLVTAGAVIAGRKVTHTLTTQSDSPTPSAAYTTWHRQAAVAEANRIVAAAQRNKSERTYEAEFNKAGTW